MTRHLHETANAVLYRALDLPAGDRQQFVAQATAGDLALFEDVRAMLSRIEQLDQFLEDPFELPVDPKPAPAPPSLPRRGDLVGRWRVERELGRNGADLILLVSDSSAPASSAPQFATMRLAQSAAPGGQTGARFERLRERLATLSHPALPAPSDAGTSAEGLPYFVVGRGAGVAIDRYCADRGLDLAARAALFARVCHAVHYMHQHLIVHRDLKPDDMLIDDTASADIGAPAITLLDVGMIGDGWPLNPAYASPDQLAGQPLSVASDIYSLGAVLYGLLSGQLAHGAAAGVVGARTAEQAVPGASQAVRAALASGAGMAADLPVDPLLAPSTALAERLQERFDAILARALAPDPAERYPSADALARALETSAHDAAPQAAQQAATQAAAPASPAVPLTPSKPEPQPALQTEDAFGAPVEWPPRRARRLALPLALAMLAAGLVGGIAAAPYAQQFAWLKPLTTLAAGAGTAVAPGLPAPAAINPAIDSVTARALSAAPAAQRSALVRAALGWQLGLADARRGAGDLAGAAQAASAALALAASLPPAERDAARAEALLRQGAIRAEQGNGKLGLADLRAALDLRAAHVAMEGPASPAAGALGVATIHRAIAAALAGSGDDAGAEAALNQARAALAARLQEAPASLDAGARAALTAQLVEVELARASAQNAQKHGKDTVATLAGLRRLPGTAGDPRIDLLEAWVQPRGTPAQAWAAAQPALAALSARNTDALDARQQRALAQAATMAAEIGLRARQNSAACARLDEAARRYEELDAARRGIADDRLARQKVALLRQSCG